MHFIWRWSDFLNGLTTECDCFAVRHGQTAKLIITICMICTDAGLVIGVIGEGLVTAAVGAVPHFSAAAA